MSDQPDFLEITKDKYTKTGYDGTDELIALALIAIAERLDKQNELLERIADGFVHISLDGQSKAMYRKLFHQWQQAPAGGMEEQELVEQMEELVLERTRG